MDVIEPSLHNSPLSDDAQAQIAALARRQKQANGVLMTAINMVGGQVEDRLNLLPENLRIQIDTVTKAALRQSFDLAHQSRKGLGGQLGSDRLHKLAGVVSGAVGGFGGLPTALIELPVTTTLIFRAVHQVAVSYGEDAGSDETRAQCLAVFGAGGPGQADDGVNTAFVGARLSLSGAAINGLINRIAPKFAALLSQKLAAQAVPVLGAAAGAGTNYAFVDYYVEMAHVHFGLRKLGRIHGQALVLDQFHQAVVTPT